jgi:CheY-like chemotaxis protein/anti-sigma regulatory factor (Ser/Thr protein kinase)
MGVSMAGNTAPRGRILIVDDDRTLSHALAALLKDAGYAVDQAASGRDAVSRLDAGGFDVVLLDVGLPDISGLDVLAHARSVASPPIVLVMTADDTPETLLAAVRRQAHRYLRKPFAPSAVVEVVDDAMARAASAAMTIEVVSARPEWVELVAPCALDMADRIQSFVMQLDANLPDKVRENVAQAFRELLNNAIEWGGKLDSQRKVRISCVRTSRLLLYRIADPGEGFDIDKLRHAAINNPEDSPLDHAMIREEQGIRPGGLGLMITRSLVDEIIYNEARNEVMFIKYL